VRLCGGFPNLNSPRDIAYDPANGFLYVTNFSNNTVTVYDQNGNQQTLSGSFPNLNEPYGIAIAP
jgi:YVTN family beta-propeller protein